MKNTRLFQAIVVLGCAMGGCGPETEEGPVGPTVEAAAAAPGYGTSADHPPGMHELLSDGGYAPVGHTEPNPGAADGGWPTTK
jgi:hypothetical protein